MLDFLQITNDTTLAGRCDALEGMRLFVDLERHGKAERQAGRNSFLSTHVLDDVGRIKAVLRRARLMVRVNPLHAGSAAEVDAVLAQGADWLMLPMFHTAAELVEFSRIVANRVPVTALLETAGALETWGDWIATPGLTEVYVGLNDLHIALGHRFMFEPLAQGLLDHIAAASRAHGLRFGFGGIARTDEGLLPGRDVLGEHLRLGSGAVILSRTFHRADALEGFEQEVGLLRQAEAGLARRSAAEIEVDRVRVRALVSDIAEGLKAQSSTSIEAAR